MKVYKVELMVIDLDELGADEIKIVIENTKYPNYCINPAVMSTQEKEVEWSDEHPLNNTSQMKEEFNKLFNS